MKLPLVSPRAPQFGEWNLDPKGGVCLIFAWPDNFIAAELAWWVQARFQDRWASLVLADQLCARNTMIAAAVASHAEWFLFVDRDVRPDHRADAIFSLAADVRACQTQHHGDQAWIWPTAFHDSLWLTTRKVLQAIGSPWFSPPAYDGLFQTRIGCLCKTFAERALAKGFSIAHGGWARHDEQRSWA